MSPKGPNIKCLVSSLTFWDVVKIQEKGLARRPSSLWQLVPSLPSCYEVNSLALPRLSHHDDVLLCHRPQGDGITCFWTETFQSVSQSKLSSSEPSVSNISYHKGTLSNPER